MELTHGGDIYSFAEAHAGALPLDFSANINPFGTPEAVQRAMHEALGQSAHYPDPLCRALRRAIGAREAVDSNWLYCGAGAADVLDRLARVIKPRCALLAAPTFAAYEQSLGDCAFRFHLLREKEQFTLTSRILTDITDEIDAVYLCNPNNPTGQAADPDLLEAVARRCAAQNTWLIVDECFLDFLPAGQSLKPLLEKMPRLVLLRAYTKIFAVPGVRLGYCMTSNTPLIERLYAAGQPWNVSVVAQACGVAAARESEFVRASAEKIAQARTALSRGLRARGMTVYPADANFLLFRAPVTDLCEKLAAHGILVRDCANFRGLWAGFYRVAVRSHEENERLLAALDRVREELWQR